MNDFEEYYQEDRKTFRKERKLAKAKDRSKYKKTDLDKRQKETSESKGERGRVISISAAGVYVDIQGKTILASLRGRLKQEKSKDKNLVTVGDFVRVDDQGQINSIEERYSHLARASNLDRRKKHFIAANIDQVFITNAVEAPSLKPSLIDRYIIAATKGNIKPIIVINKVDLAKDHTFLDEVESIYRNLNIPFYKVSAKSGLGIEDLTDAMSGKTSLFSGQSGVGKTSLINAITGRHARVGSVVHKTQKGAHTTTRANLIPLDNGGFCVDTPGIKSFGLWDITPNELLSYFSDLQVFALSCKYQNCTHIHEPDCMVKQAVNEGKISKIRYESYLTIHEGITNGESNPRYFRE